MSNDKVNKEINRKAGQPEQFPVNRMGLGAPNSFFGTHRVFFEGTTGLVGSSYGLPGVTVGRLRTGIYGIRFPTDWRSVSILPGLQVPTGFDYDAKIAGMSGVGILVGQSGGAELHISRAINAPVITTTNPSTYVQAHDPVTGTMAELHFFVTKTPITPF